MSGPVSRASGWTITESNGGRCAEAYQPLGCASERDAEPGGAGSSWLRAKSSPSVICAATAGWLARMWLRALLTSSLTSSPRTTVPHSHTMTCLMRVVSHLVREPMPSRIQLCGPLLVRLAGTDVTDELPGAQGRLLLAYLVANRARLVTRAELAEALWAEMPPSQPANALRALLSKLRRALALGHSDALPAGELLQLTLPRDAWVDTEAATQALHDAQSAVAQGEDVRAWIASHIALNVTSRVFLLGHDGDWVGEQRAALGEIRQGALEALAECALRLGGPERDTAVRAGAELVELAPYRESGYGHLMEALAAQGNPAEALLVFEQLRRRLRDDLGAVPGQQIQALHARLLGG